MKNEILNDLQNLYKKSQQPNKKIIISKSLIDSYILTNITLDTKIKELEKKNQQLKQQVVNLQIELGIIKSNLDLEVEAKQTLLKEFSEEALAELERRKK